jgi:transcriptional regulator with XRE-family HTH domain
VKIRQANSIHAKPNIIGEGSNMEIGNEKVREYIVALKNTGNFSYEDIANLSGIPLQTVRNIYTGKTPDPRFATVAKIIISLGGDLNEIIGYEKKKEIEVNSTVSLKETYEMRIADLIKSYETRIEDIKALCDQRVDDAQKCCEIRIADMRQSFKERLAEQREMLTK